MLKRNTHIFLFMLMFLTFQQIVLSASITQAPEVNRVFDSDFKKRYTGKKYNYEGKKVVKRTPQGSGKYEAYKNEEIKPKEVKNSNDNDIVINFGAFGWLFYLILAIAVVYLAYVLLNEGGTGLFASGKNKSIERYDAITAENIEHTDIHALIKQAENDKDYRLAIRYYYLLVLKTLSLKKHIKFEDDKTNAEYLNEISEKPFSKSFSYTSYLYNYIWYGKFSLEETQYFKAKKNFITLLNQVN